MNAAPLVTACIAIVGLVVACGGSERASSDTGCRQGSTRTCIGPAACAGGQNCRANGTWSACDCGPDGGLAGAGAAATGGSGGTGAAAGSGGTGAAAGSSGAAGSGPGGASGAGGSAGRAGTAGAAACGAETCNDSDDDGDGKIDELEDICPSELSRVVSCGNCQTNCLTLLGPNHTDVRCDPPATWGAPGRCSARCVDDFYDVDPSAPGCEYYCPWNPDGNNVLDLGGADGCGKDDDCDGARDEDVDLCGVTDCGFCGHRCFIANGTATCVSDTSPASCDAATAGCEVDSCFVGWYDANQSPDDGCEYECPTQPPAQETCDGVDNDCDALIDEGC